MALEKMNAYYNDNPDIKSVVDGTNPDCNTCIFAFEGLGDPSLKKEDDNNNIVDARDTNISKEHMFWRFMAMMVVTKGKEIVYATRRASTLPDQATSYSYSTANREKGPTTLKERIYGYSMGNHQSTYVALKPTDDYRVAWYRNDGAFVCSDSSGTNLHASTAAISDRYKNSTGCQLVHYLDYVAFGKAVGFLKDTNDLNNMAPWKTGNFGVHVYNYVNNKDGDYASPISVKYILDRTYDETNSFYSDSKKFDEYAKELANIEMLSNSTTEAIQRADELRRYLSYYDSIDDSYKQGIFYPISKQCNVNVCELH